MYCLYIIRMFSSLWMVENMKKEFEKWVADKADLLMLYYIEIGTNKKDDNIISIGILMKAMWAINSGTSGYDLFMDYDGIIVNHCRSTDKFFEYYKYNFSEVKSLTKALEYVMDNEQKDK